MVSEERLAGERLLFEFGLLIQFKDEEYDKRNENHHAIDPNIPKKGESEYLSIGVHFFESSLVWEQKHRIYNYTYVHFENPKRVLLNNS